jgi:hypothetical protein
VNKFWLIVEDETLLIRIQMMGTKRIEHIAFICIADFYISAADYRKNEVTVRYSNATEPLELRRLFSTQSIN